MSLGVGGGGGCVLVLLPLPVSIPMSACHVRMLINERKREELRMHLILGHSIPDIPLHLCQFMREDIGVRLC